MLKEIRKKQGFSVRVLSEKSGIPLRTIQDWERFGIGRATVRGALAVCRALGCTLDELVAGEVGRDA